MPLDINRIRTNLSNDRDAYRYYREIIPSSPATAPSFNPKKSSWIKTRPVLVTFLISTCGLAVAYGLYKYREEPEKRIQVENHVAQLKQELDEYNSQIEKS
jgi:hypothetical protein